jgi:GT2 family glycosyltransferase
MALRRFELEDLLIRPGTYFNPQTEVLVVVDDSPEIDNEIFDDDFDGDEWVLIADDTPVDEIVRDDLIEKFQASNAPTVTGAIPADMDDEDEVDDIKADLEEDEDGSIVELDPDEL